MKETIEMLRYELNEKLLEIDSMETGIDKLGQLLTVIDKAITQINQTVERSAFEKETDEIIFFKVQKPELLARRIEEVMRYNITSNIPIGTPENKIKFLEDELRARRSFFRMNSFHYQYYKKSLTELDRIFFLRSARAASLPLSEFSETENEFSTPMSYLFAKFMAYENIQYFLLEQIAMIRYPESILVKSPQMNNDLKWTGDAVNAVELAYGLWLTGQLNDGNASLNQIVRWLESNFHVSIGIIQRRFSEIERRKRVSITKFIDLMKEAILRKTDEDNS
ncbi:hypothetical protein D0C36_19320 [Mucilaginibacter conchicola]|uniref:RteC protein n=1 Tax=Mucilaginibacter conchicola TaxID=2303333 RepID=A0A372NQ83_9SPHI|nr:RteC domain-containing protein [Mucilaginibacter conchicola]RFZ91094.1 hypothetical protein D0C36_19320 [Mucilaginibacter conchicola]